MSNRENLLAPEDCVDVEQVPVVTPEIDCVDVEQVVEVERERTLQEGNRPAALLTYLVLGAFLGVVFVQSEVVSWFRIQEMFRFQGFHMYGIIGSAIAVAALSIQLIRRMQLKTVHGETIELSPKQWGESSIAGARYWIGGGLFGLGWALLGACPGPIFALLGVGIVAPATGLTVMAVALISALAGTWVYASIRHVLPH
ncbi:hypothetical protein BH23BAC4_BH23BAC4_00230 [soil metagenome]